MEVVRDGGCFRGRRLWKGEDGRIRELGAWDREEQEGLPFEKGPMALLEGLNNGKGNGRRMMDRKELSAS